MLATFVAILVAGIFCVPAEAQNANVSGAELLKHLAGTWRAAEERTPRTTALDEQVFGRNPASHDGPDPWIPRLARDDTASARPANFC